MQTKVAGQPCPDCNELMIQGKNGGGYCKPCYIKWKNQTKDQPKPAKPAQQDVDWDKIARGKVKHAFAVESFKMKMALDQATKDRINQWTDFVMQEELPTIQTEEQVETSEIPF